MSEYLYGSTVRLGNTFTDTAGDAYDPDTVSLTIYDTEGASKKVVTYAAGEITKDSIGVYRYDYDIPADATSQGYWIGVWTVTITSTGQSDVSEEQFYARPPAEKLYAAVSEVKDALMSSGVTMSDETARKAIRAAMAECDVITGRTFTNGNTKTEWFDTNQANPNGIVNKIFLSCLPVQSITSLKEYDTSKALVETHAATDYWFDDNGIVELTTDEFAHQRHRVECVYTYGYTAVPMKVSKLCSVISQIEVMRHSMIAADDQMTSFSIPDIGTVSLGEVYVTSVRAIEQLEKQKKALIAEIGNLRNDVNVV